MLTAFESLQDKLRNVFQKIGGQPRLNAKNIEEMLSEIRFALLDADVNNRVAKSFIDDLRTHLIGKRVAEKLNPSQTVLKIVADEMTELLGGEEKEIDFSSRSPKIIMAVGLQGGGKTTSCAKLARYLTTKYQKRPLLVGLDVYRPGAIDQLEQLATANNFGFYAERDNLDVVSIAKNAVDYAKSKTYDIIILDTAGRLQIDEKLMDELKRLKAEIKPQEILLVVDSLGGQEAALSAAEFNAQIGVDGAIMTKLDSDARGGAALSMARLSGIRIYYASVGEKVTEFELFHPRRMAERILGMGDLLTLIEKAQAELDEKRTRGITQRLLNGTFNLEDMLYQLEAARKMGPLGSLAKMLPGAPQISEADEKRAEIRTKKMKAAIYSMTVKERRHPEILKASRKERVAKGAGLNVSDVNAVLRQYEQTKQTMKRLAPYFRGGRMPFRR